MLGPLQAIGVVLGVLVFSVHLNLHLKPCSSFYVCCGISDVIFYSVRTFFLHRHTLVLMGLSSSYDNGYLCLVKLICVVVFFFDSTLAFSH